MCQTVDIAVSASAFVLTGDFAHCGNDRDKIKALIVEKGGRYTTAVSGKTNCLVLGSQGGFGKRRSKKFGNYRKRERILRSSQKVTSFDAAALICPVPSCYPRFTLFPCGVQPFWLPLFVMLWTVILLLSLCGAALLSQLFSFPFPFGQYFFDKLKPPGAGRFSSWHKKEPHGQTPCGPSGWDIGKLPISKYHVFQVL